MYNFPRISLTEQKQMHCNAKQYASLGVDTGWLVACKFKFELAFKCYKPIDTEQGSFCHKH